MIQKVVTLPRLMTVQILSAGADHILPYIPAVITLGNARGAYTAATAEWAAGAIPESRERAYRVVGEQLARLAAGQPLQNVIGDHGY